MNARSTVLSVRRPTLARPPAQLVVVADRPDVPGWALDWCRRSGRELRTHAVPATAPAGPSAAAHLVRALGGLAGHSVLVARPAPERPGPPRVVAALRDLPGDAPVLADAAQSAAQLGATLVVAHGVPLSFGERSVGLDAALDRGRRLLDAAARTAAEIAGLEVVPQLLRMRPHELVGEGLDADLLVLGGPHAYGAEGLGLVTLTALHHAPCPILLVPRGAQSPS